MRIEYHTLRDLEAKIKEIREMKYMLGEREWELLNLHMRLEHDDPHREGTHVIDNRARVIKLGRPVYSGDEAPTTAYNDAIREKEGYLSRYRQGRVIHS